MGGRHAWSAYCQPIDLDAVKRVLHKILECEGE